MTAGEAAADPATIGAAGEAPAPQPDSRTGSAAPDQSEPRSRIEQQHPQPIPPDERKRQQERPETPAAPA